MRFEARPDESSLNLDAIGPTVDFFLSWASCSWSPAPCLPPPYTVNSLASPMIEIGQRVRVTSKDGNSSLTGMVSAVNSEEATFDVFVDDAVEGNEEEISVPLSRIRPLEGFELRDIKLFSLSELKAHGNTLFGLKDYFTASKFYQQAIQKSSNMYNISLGCNVVVLRHPDLPKGMTCVDGIISESDVNENNEEVFEVMLPNQTEISGVKLSQLIPLPQDRESLILLRSIYLNLARCDMKRNHKGWTAHHASIAVAISEVLWSDLRDKGSAETDDLDRSEEFLETNQLLADALYFRAKAFVAAARPGLATKDFRQLQALDQSKRVVQLKTEIDNFRAKRVKDNQRLAKDIARWVDDVMTGKAKSSNQHDMDIDLGDDFNDDDEGSTAATAKSMDSIATCSSSSTLSNNTNFFRHETVDIFIENRKKVFQKEGFISVTSWRIIIPLMAAFLLWVLIKHYSDRS